MGIDKKLLEILACPKCRGKLHLEEDRSGLICKSCELKYPIEDGIPVMLIDEAIRVETRNEELGKTSS